MPDFPPPPTPTITLPDIPERIRRLREAYVNMADEQSFSVTDLPAGERRYKLLYTYQMGNPLVSYEGSDGDIAGFFTDLPNLEVELRTTL